MEFNALGQFIKAWGWGVDTGANELQVCTSLSTCQAGLAGTGAGEFGPFDSPQGLAVDSAGEIYAVDRGLPSNQRVQKFSRDGQFILMFGGHVNKTKTEEGGSTEAERNLCTAASGDECRVGSEGTGKGQFGTWPFIGDFITVDDKGTGTAGDDKVYVGDQNRIQVFNAEGHYLESLPLPGITVNGLANDTAGNLYAIYSTDGKVHKLSPTGAPLSPEVFAIPVLAPLEKPAATAVAVDATGHVYAFGPPTGGSGSGNPRNPIVEFDSSGKVIEEFGKGEFTAASTGLATNLCLGSEAPGNLYASNPSETAAFVRAYGTEPVGCFKARTGVANPIEKEAATLNGTVNPSGLAVSECFFEYGMSTSYGQTAQCEPSAGELGTGTDPVAVHADIGSLEKGTVYHFRLIAKVGPEVETGSDEEFKTLGPPTISAEHVVSVAFTEATLKALVNPEGFDTEYHFEYTTQEDFDAHGFIGAQSTTPIDIGSARGDRPVVANLKGLEPGTDYRWRVVAGNESGGIESADHPLATYRSLLPETGCSNQAFRTDASSLLPDCRAYEMVSPVDKNGGDIVSGISGPGNPGGYVQSSPDGERLAYGVAFVAFAGEPTSFKFNEYFAARSGGGWSNQGIHPPVPGHLCCESLGLTFGLIREFIAFSQDLCSAWVYDSQAPTLLADAQAGYPNIYRRQNCGAGAGGLETLTSSPPALPGGTSVEYVNPHSVEGLSADASHVFLVASAQLNSEAAEGPKAQIYDRFEGASHLVSVLPGGVADGTGAAVGSGPSGPTVGAGNLDNAVSEDGSRVYWTSGITSLETGKIFIRQHPEQGIVAGECTEASKACTLQVSKGAAAFYWTAAADGSKALYDEEGKLIVFDLSEAEKKAGEGKKTFGGRLVAENVKGVAGASDDLSRIYFVSTDVLAGSGENSEGEEAQPGQPNLYLDEGGAKSFVATLAVGDTGGKEPGSPLAAYNDISIEPNERATRVNPDGSRIVFNSRALLTEFDNTDPASGKPAVEVYSYEAGGELSCVSCNPSGGQVSGVRELRLPYRPPFEFNTLTLVQAAAWIPTWEHKLHASNVLSEDGGRIFFNSNDALLPRDANGAPDVYEWEAPGTGSCSEESPSFFAGNGGCLYLISSGESPHESEFWEASPDGSNVFFTTESSLLPQDPGSIDLYDARVDGGFPQPSQAAACEGEACQSPPAPPNDPTPASSAFQGAGNVREKAPVRCHKAKVRRHGRCVDRHRKAKHRAHKRRTAR